MEELQPEVGRSNSIRIFKKLLVSVKSENFLFSIYDLLGVRLLTHRRLQSSHLN